MDDASTGSTTDEGVVSAPADNSLTSPTNRDTAPNDTNDAQNAAVLAAKWDRLANGGWLESERRYMQRRLESRIEDRTKMVEKERNYLCTVCSALCESMADLQKHLSKHVSDLKMPLNSRVCSICSLEFINRMALNVHRNSPRHKEREMRIRSLFHCDHCGHYFANRDAYAMHMLDVTREAAAAQPNQNGGASGQKTPSATANPYLGLVMNEVDTLSFLQSLAGNTKPSHDTGRDSTSPVEIVKVKEEPRDDAYGDSPCKNGAGVTSSTEEAPSDGAASNLVGMKLGFENERKSRSGEPLDLTSMKHEETLRLSPIDGHICRVCSQIFDSRDSLAMHAMEHCKDDSNSPGISSARGGGSITTPTIACHICGHQPSSLQSLSLHIITAHSQPIGTANRLDLSRDSALPLRDVKSMLPGNNVTEALSRSIGYGDLATDIIQQNSLTSFTCKICNIEFASIFAVTRHCSCVSHILKLEQLLRRSFVSPDVHKCQDCGKTFERDCDFKIHKSLLCPNIRPTSPLQSPLGQSSVCSEPATRKRLSVDTSPNYTPKRARSVSSDNALPLTSTSTLWAAPSTSRKDPFPRRTPGPEVPRPSSNVRPPSVDSGRSASPDHEALANRQQIMTYLENLQDLQMCAYCKIVYTDRTMYYLHMGLHNHNNPWQCNLCGKVCANVHEFSSHVIHYS